MSALSEVATLSTTAETYGLERLQDERIEDNVRGILFRWGVIEHHEEAAH